MPPQLKFDAVEWADAPATTEYRAVSLERDFLQSK